MRRLVQSQQSEVRFLGGRRSKQPDLLQQFRQGQRNLIIATNVFEEGIDLTACHVVISFDLPDNLKSFIQRRGRARQRQSKFVLMLPNGDDKWISRWKQLEEQMVQMYADHQRTLAAMNAVESLPERMSYELRLETG